jgi:hypothetical protein
MRFSQWCRVLAFVSFVAGLYVHQNWWACMLWMLASINLSYLNGMYKEREERYGRRSEYERY